MIAINNPDRTPDENEAFRLLAELNPEVISAGQGSHDTIGTPLCDPIEAASTGRPYSMTDLGNAERLVHWFGDRIHWDMSRGCWRVWSGTRWQADNEITLLEFAGQSARKIRKEASVCPPPKEGQVDVGAMLWKHAKASESRDRLSACVAVAKSLRGVALNANEWDKNPMVLNVSNGTIDLATGKLLLHNREALITRLAPITYNPHAKSPRWEMFLSDSCGGDPELIKYLQKVAGYCLTGSTTEECLFFVYGVAASGKTTFLETLKSMAGEYSETIDAEMLCKDKYSDSAKASPEVARLDGARLAAGSEIEAGRELSTAKLKSITGGEKIIARFMRSNPFEFTPQFKILLAMNDCPKAPSEDGGLWRRMRRIEFSHEVPKEQRDKTLKPYLQKEGAAAVLAWAVRGCLLWQEEGLEPPEAVEASTAQYKEDSDPLNTWAEDCLNISAGAWATNAEIMESYADYCTENGITYRVGAKTIARKLIALGCSKGKKHDGRGWTGVEIGAGDDTPEAKQQEFETINIYETAVLDYGEIPEA